MSNNGARKSIECDKVLKFITRSITVILKKALNFIYQIGNKIYITVKDNT